MARLLIEVIALPVLALSVFASGIAPAKADDPTSTCVFASKTYSEGAYVCAQKSLMLGCSADSGKLMWKTVTDAGLNALCEGTAAVAPEPTPRAERRHRHRRYATQGFQLPFLSARCFPFNGRRYCE